MSYSESLLPLRASTLATAVAAVAYAAAALGSTAAFAQATDVKIGFAAPLTGGQAHYGADFRSGVELAIEDMNATNPVIGGKPVHFVLDAQDDQADPRVGTTVAQKLVDDGVVAVIGHYNSGTSIPAAPIYAKAGVPEIAMATAPTYTRLGLPTTFRLLTSDTQLGSVLGDYVAKDLKFKRFAVVDDRTAYGQGVAEEFSKAVKAAGATVVDQEYTNDKAVDFRAILTKIKAANVDAVFYGGADTQAAPMLKQMRTLAINATLIGPDMLQSDNLIKVAGPAAEGTLAASEGSPLAQMPNGKEFAEHYSKRFGQPVELYAPYAYDGTMAVFNAMKKAGSTDPHVYLAALKATNMKGITTNELSYDQYGDLKYGGVTVYKVVNGKWVPSQTVGTK
ncbi:branched-chain amino acid ABC transporter substrate-binding protein [Paraburkholderia caballeronis]|uniref:branched-chain amino acid ABC transporter substrate-binding protein n=1 Tax=Paraburkholderia caballeronis TaxID=416943 RepID=UPI0010653BF5|nr:branched-chain amino acid ABC transporter substrate-binding protein [Paraburkholderia caballeronis]TDV07802.1 branched-chain amino acid transport system substrate-binding protein [Paraburkholderia caballeronis]TDV11165.1 branched-chain amino acid transport system substrate-binding protein [Paraburkholderia caballeronis]TDV21545.1 branched-chain amino acid transport system substrate-binding protein [Paraburkholderia caballeronis]